MVAAAIKDHLVPADGISTAKIRFAGCHKHDAGSVFRFEIFQGESLVGTFQFVLPDKPDESFEQMALKAHYMMNDALRQMLYQNEDVRKVYEKNVGTVDKDGGEE